MQIILSCPLSVKDIWLDDENDLIRSCGALSKVIININIIIISPFINDNLAQASLTPPLVGMGDRAKASPGGHQRAEDIAGLLFCSTLNSDKPATKVMTRLLGTATTKGRNVFTADHQLISSSPPGL